MPTCHLGSCFGHALMFAFNCRAVSAGNSICPVEKSDQISGVPDLQCPNTSPCAWAIPKVENPARQHGLTLNEIAERHADIPELQQTTVVMRAQAYRRNLFAELDRVKDLLLL